MPRPPSFDADVAIDRAMLLFWSKGYAGTSVQELVEGTKLLRGSLYHAFGDKRSLYIHAVQRYGQIALQQARDQWDPTRSAYDNVRAGLRAIVELPEGDKRRGSMLCNCIAEVVPHDPEIARIVAGILEDIKHFYRAMLVRAQHAGELAPQVDVTALARHLVSSIQGLCTTAKAGAPREELLDIVEVTLSVLR
jgi:TetR/AcrR family transcriptional repressor of nem operon